MSTPEEQVTLEQEQAGRNPVGGRRLALIVGGAVALVVLLWLLFLRGGGDTPESTTAPPAPPVATPAPTPEERGGGGGGRRGDDPVETFEVFAPKDPFDPLVTEEGGGGGTGDTAGAGDEDGTTDTDGTPDTGGTDTNGDGVVDADDGGADTSADVEGHTVELVATLDGGRAQVQVDSTVYTVDEGERFAQNFELVSVSSECATLLYGDDQFTLCEGEEILK